MEEHSEPYQVITEFSNDRIEDGSGKDHECKVINKRTSQKINQPNQNQDEMAFKRKLCNPIRCNHRNLRHCNKMSKYGGACDE